MRKQLAVFAGVIAGAVVGSASAFAQSPAPPPTPPSEVSPAANIPDSEKLQRSSDYLGQMRGGLKVVLGKLEEARSSKDVVKLNCVNEKLTNIKGLLRISEQADISLQEAVAKKEGEASEHEYTKVVIARQKVEQLRVEAEQCIGQLAFEVDREVKVEVIIPENLPQSDPTQTAPPAPVLTRPVPASPTS
jgi:hypothetical protein